MPADPDNSAAAPLHVAGIIDEDEARLLIECGFDHLGFPLGLDYHAEDLSIADAAAIVSILADRATFFAITYYPTAEKVLDLCRRIGVNMVQLHGEIALEEIARLRQLSPELIIIKSLVVGLEAKQTLETRLRAYAPLVDVFITDTFDRQTGAKGATGKTHDWKISRRLVEISPKPVILAGGLTAANVSQAIQEVRPAGVDVHTGIEGPDGRKRRDLALEFATAARAALRAAI